MAEVCNQCGGMRWRRSARGWTQCLCYWDALAEQWIKPPLRVSSDGPLDPKYHQIACWPLEDLHIEGVPWIDKDQQLREAVSWDDFRFTAWRSLIELYERGLSYLVIDGTRLVDIYFNRDPDPDLATPQGLVDWQLVIMVLGRGDVTTNPYYPHAIFRAREVRKFAGKPTWIYAQHGWPRVGGVSEIPARVPAESAVVRATDGSVITPGRNVGLLPPRKE